ncbi:ABC transporter ATP-binding protein [Demequina muriae]|uniref:ABC transporter ATP-binding protein n=1 Tax=Demequina muriae TaxID=3051664 RepID=A0ABT8GEH6_9MICO|nr:ABC transporter ATP-binding protein [Demequina sp. EGI L300058]MDN4479838.1 ABC transporter ATP-binding protein [Demequina sp. EGI L300058]
MTAIVEATGLTKRFGRVHAVEDATFSLDEGGIHGLLGRNGAGKTTMMQLLTGQEFATEGEARIFGESPVENAHALRRVCFIKESQVYPDGFKGKHVLRSAPWFFDRWDAAFAERLVRAFNAPLDRPMKKMSRGQRSAIGVIVGLASRAELTFLDEPYAGLDAVARQRFYDLLLEDYTAHPRTVVLSTHLIDEAANLLQRVLVIDDGRIVIDADADELRATATTLVGRAADVEAYAVGREVLDRTTLGGIASITVAGLSAEERRAAASAGLEASPVSLQGLVVSRTGGVEHDDATKNKEKSA